MTTALQPDKVQRMHVAVSSALEGISSLFKPGMKLTFVARMPGNPEADVLIGDDQDPIELIALVQRRFAECAAAAPDAVPADLAYLMEYLPTAALREEAKRKLSALAAPVVGDAPQQAAITQAARDVLAERQRQVEVEGWTPEHDDRYSGCQLARVAATYALCSHIEQLKLCGAQVWPWHPDWWKRGSYRRDLEKAGALIIAEIERIDRAALPAPLQVERETAGAAGGAHQVLGADAQDHSEGGHHG